MGCCSGFWMWVLPMGFLWWLFASALLYASWNHAIVAVTAAKKIQFKHALLLVFTLGVLCAPHHAQNGWGGNCHRMQLKLEEHDNDNGDVLKLP